VLLLLLFWRMTRSEPANDAKAAAAPITTLGPLKTGEVPGATATTPTPAAKPTPAGKTAGKESGNGVAPGRTQWRVVAYTFNKENQAQQKADSLAKRNPSLNPQVFTPNGRAPYLVTVGGLMTREQAEAFKKKALSAGLPHDLYAQNYAH
jgi:Sporulation related domain.